MLARLYDSHEHPGADLARRSPALLVAVGLIRARSAHADGDEIAAFTLVGLTSAAVGPVTHIHELVWVLPAVLILVDAAARRRRPPAAAAPARTVHRGRLRGAAAVWSTCSSCVDPRWTVGWDAYALALIVLLNALPWRAGVARPSRSTAGRADRARRRSGRSPAVAAQTRRA